MNQEEHLILRALADLKILVVGGDVRPQAVERIKLAFALDDVIHCVTRSGDPSPRRFISKLDTPGLALVVCARGLTRTQHGKDLHDQCRRLGLPLVDCRHIPHPHSLIDSIIKARLTSALMRRSEVLRGPVHAGLGGAR